MELELVPITSITVTRFAEHSVSSSAIVNDVHERAVGAKHAKDYGAKANF